MSADRRGHSPCAAGSFSSSEREELASVAQGLPPGWVLCVEPPYGQIAVYPVRERRQWYMGCFYASPDGRSGALDWRKAARG